MEIVIMAAVSVDGFISTIDGDSDWVLDDEIFEKTVNEYGCIALGRTTFEQYAGDAYPMNGVQHIVLSSKQQTSNYETVHLVTSVEQAITKAQELGFNKLLVIGGAKTNESFMQSGQVSKLFMDVHPLALGEGKRLFGEYIEPVKLKLIDSKQYPEGFDHIEYSII